MADSILPQSTSYLGSAAGNLLGTSGSNTSTAAGNVFGVGQFQPYSINNPLGQTSFSGGTANTTMSPLQTQLSGLFGNQISSNLSNSSTSSYNPNTSFLPQQYQQIFGNMQGNANSMFNSLQAAQQPFTSQYLQSNLDNEQAKGTLASTAGAYQTAGAQTAANSQMNQNQATAQQYALQNAQAQFGAASSTAQLGEQQSEFGPQFAQSQTQGLYSNLLNNASLLNQQTSLGGSLGALQSNANTNAAMPSFTAAQQQDQAQSGLLNGLLTGNGTGGLLGSLLGTSGSGSTGSGGLLGGIGGSVNTFLSNMFGNSTVNGITSTDGSNDGLFGGSTGQATNPFNGLASQGGSTAGGFNTQGAADIENGMPYDPSMSINTGSSTDSQLNDSNDQLLQELGFSSAGGQATNPQSISDALAFNDQELTQLYGSPNLAPPSPSASPNLFGAAGSALNFGLSANAGSGLGMAGSATGLASALGAPSSITSPVGTGISLAGLGMNLASGNVLGAVGGALGLGGKAGLPSYITQPLALALSAMTGNPVGMAVGAYNVGKGVINKIEGNQWNGNLLPDQSELESNTDQMVNSDLGVQTPTYQLNPAVAAWGAAQAQNFDTSTYMQENSQNYAGQPTLMMNQGESETPIATMDQDTVNFLSQLPAGYFSN